VAGVAVVILSRQPTNETGPLPMGKVGQADGAAVRAT